jgi:hypothetical protein
LIWNCEQAEAAFGWDILHRTRIAEQPAHVIRVYVESGGDGIGIGARRPAFIQAHDANSAAGWQIIHHRRRGC